MYLALYEEQLRLHAILLAMSSHTIVVHNGKEHVLIYIADPMGNPREFTPFIRKIKYEPRKSSLFIKDGYCLDIKCSSPCGSSPNASKLY